ncbi:MAG: tRNA (adenosine(37)-N6)-dimethylallyltransferase MiaA [Bacteroidales bacterium]|nr:tRNA (adenosine(37)-N6)-dimethylallyltransferase MiaA [Bacteroidales bacterium]
MSKTLYIVIGATASGKTSFAIELARQLKTEIVSADSRQIFKEMNIGVARPSEDELKAVKHHLIATWSIHENYNVARYEKEAMSIIAELFSYYDDVVLCGGSGMYVNAVINGIDDMPDTPVELRSQLNNELNTLGLEVLLQELKAKDEKYYTEVDKQNPRRVLRALEVIRQTGKPFSSFRTEEKVKRNFDIKIIGLQRSRQELINRINKRVDEMFDAGLLEEVRSLVPFKSVPALSTVGYRELFDYFDGKISVNQASELIKIHTRQYAKRQMTWFRKTDNVEWKML